MGGLLWPRGGRDRPSETAGAVFLQLSREEHA